MSANLLFLYGPSGSGKTRLLQMISGMAKEEGTERVGCEQIVYDMTRCFENRNYAGFFDRYTSVESLFIDNIWILKRRPNTAKEIGLLIASRVTQGKLTIVASDLEYHEVVRSLPAIGDCLEKNGAIHLKLGPRDPEGTMAAMPVFGRA